MDEIENRDHIEIYDQALSADFCNEIITQFEQSGQAVPGVVGKAGSVGANDLIKDSVDITITKSPGWESVLQRFNAILGQCLIQYVRKNTFLLFGDIGREIVDNKSGQRVILDHKNMGSLPDSAIQYLISYNYRLTHTNVQKYLKGVGGYHRWHSEIAPVDANFESLHIVLFYLVYLNDVEEGGETEFYYQKRLLEPRQGRLIISPAGFTHTHKGNIPLSNDKYILTSWILFNRFEEENRMQGLKSKLS